MDYNRSYKHKKAYFYWDSGLVGRMFIYTSKLKKDIVFLYFNITLFQILSDTKSLWIAVKRKNGSGSQTNCVWSWRMASVYVTCNNVIACY